MNRYLLATLAGAVCLPSTYCLTREGSILLSALLVAGIGSAAGWMIGSDNGETNRTRTGLLMIAFVGGVLLSEAVAFWWYYWSYGYEDPKLVVGVAVSIWEFAALGGIGGFSLLLVVYMKQRITTRFNRRRH